MICPIVYDMAMCDETHQNTCSRAQGREYTCNWYLFHSMPCLVYTLICILRGTIAQHVVTVLLSISCSEQHVHACMISTCTIHSIKVVDQTRHRVKQIPITCVLSSLSSAACILMCLITHCHIINYGTNHAKRMTLLLW